MSRFHFWNIVYTVGEEDRGAAYPVIDLMWLLISRELHISWASEDPTLDPVYVSEMYSH